MVEFTLENYREEARKNLTLNRIFEEEFDSVLRLPLNINKSLTKCNNGSRGGNARVLINDCVTFFNYFHRDFGFGLMKFLVGKNNEPGCNALGKFFKVWDGDCDEALYEKLLEETRG